MKSQGEFVIQKWGNVRVKTIDERETVIFPRVILQNKSETRHHQTIPGVKVLICQYVIHPILITPCTHAHSRVKYSVLSVQMSINQLVNKDIENHQNRQFRWLVKRTQNFHNVFVDLKVASVVLFAMCLSSLNYTLSKLHPLYPDNKASI